MPVERALLDEPPRSAWRWFGLEGNSRHQQPGCIGHGKRWVARLFHPLANLGFGYRVTTIKEA